jgi:DNA-binding FadR family transcriptional regulator
MAADERPGRLSEQIHDRLRRDILDGRLAPGDAVRSERALADEFGVNRHAVREALKRLEQAGLVRISQGGATRVLDWRDSGGLEVLLDLLTTGGDPPPPEITRSVLEMRASIGIDAARRCAARAPGDARAGVRRLADEAAEAVGLDAAALDDRFAALWGAIVAGSGNVAYRLSLNSLVAALDAYAEIADAIRPADPRTVRALGTAIGEGDADGAAAAARTLLEDELLKRG